MGHSISKLGFEVLPCPTTYRVGGELSPYTRYILTSIEQFALFRKIASPDVISGCRSREQQLALQREWDRGNRSGLAVRPADPENSRHIAGQDGFCRAFDLGNSSEWLKDIGPWTVKAFPGVRWGGYFIPKDLGHFDTPLPLEHVATFRLT
jgi:hypothetical protein